MHTRRLLPVAIALTCLVAAGCGGDDDDTAATTLPVVTALTTTTASPGATNPPATNPPATNPPATNPPATNPPATTEPPAATEAPATEGQSGTSGGYTAGLGPAYPQDHTAAVTDPLADGVYWATASNADDSSITFDVVQAWFGDDCLTHFNGDAEMCLDDYGIEMSPSATLSMALDGTTVSVLDAGAGAGASYQITGAELARLVLNDAPADDAPAGFVYTGFPFLLTVQDGAIIGAGQIFTP